MQPTPKRIAHSAAAASGRRAAQCPKVPPNASGAAGDERESVTNGVHLGGTDTPNVLSKLGSADGEDIREVGAGGLLQTFFGS